MHLQSKATGCPSPTSRLADGEKPGLTSDFDREASPKFVRRIARVFFLMVFQVLLLAGCRTLPPLAPVNFADSSWKIQQGQAVWTPQRGAPELAGEVLFATHPSGRSVVQFTKTPFPFVIAQVTAQEWQIEFVPQNRIIHAPGKPPSRFGWLQLLPALRGQPAPPPWAFRRENDNWRLENQRTGEIIEGFLNP